MIDRLATICAAPIVPDPLQGALMDSRQRWRDLVALSADFAFETDADGNLLFVIPDPALGWSAAGLVGRPASLLLAGPEGADGFDPFRAISAGRRKRVWVRKADGGMACLAFAVAPVLDTKGHVTGTRGVGVDMTDYDTLGGQVAAALRRGEMLDLILWRMGQEVLAPRMMDAALAELVKALGATGAGVVAPAGDGMPSRFLHLRGEDADPVLEAAVNRLGDMAGSDPIRSVALDGRQIILAVCQTRFGAHAGLVAWRALDGRPWDNDDLLLIGSAANIIRMVLEHEAIQSEMARQARTDPLTGLLNRRAFFEEIDRHIARLEHESLPGTLVFADLDNFKQLNDGMGHDMGDAVLVEVGRILRRLFRPTDLVARFGGDEFAVWMSGADRLTAAERAEWLREHLPVELAKITGPEGPRLSLSMGLVTRQPACDESMDSLMRRADAAMYEVKRNGRGHWRVSMREGE